MSCRKSISYKRKKLKQKNIFFKISSFMGLYIAGGIKKEISYHPEGSPEWYLFYNYSPVFF
jgi:hypothetical protein